MTRRNFIFLSSFGTSLLMSQKTLSMFSSFSSYIKPKALNEGDTIGIIAPGTAVTDPESIYKVKEVTNYFNLNYKLGKNLLKGSGYKSRTIEERLEDLHNMFIDDKVKAIFCIRGGYGSIQLLDKIDYNIIKQNPKIFLGFSDITVLHLAINKYAELVTFHGPVLISQFSNWTIPYFKKALFSSESIGKISIDQKQNNIRKLHPVWTIAPGKNTGKLIGGNLTMICSLLGTPYEIQTEGKILFLEDVDEEPYRIDRMLTQLRLAGKLDKTAGIIFGECSNCSSDRLQPSRVWDFTLGEVLNNILGDLKVPVVYGIPIGHTSDQITIPIGVEASLDADYLNFEITESGVVS